jgi:hypothetical protein
VRLIRDRVMAGEIGDLAESIGDQPRGRCRLGLSGLRRGRNPVTTWSGSGVPPPMGKFISSFILLHVLVYCAMHVLIS